MNGELVHLRTLEGELIMPKSGNNVKEKIEEKYQRAFNFDLDKKALKDQGFEVKFPKALVPYKMIAAELKKMGIEHRQYSGYRSQKPLSNKEALDIILRLDEALPWLCYCVKKFDITKIEEQYDMSTIFENSRKRAELQKNEKADDVSAMSVDEKADGVKKKPDTLEGYKKAIQEKRTKDIENSSNDSVRNKDGTSHDR